MSNMNKIRSIMRHGKVPISKVEDIINNPDDFRKAQIVGTVLHHPELTEKHLLDIVKNHSNRYLLSRVMRHEKTTPQTVSKLIDDGDIHTAKDILRSNGHELTNKEHIEKIHDKIFGKNSNVKDYSFYDIGEHFARHPHTPDHILKKILDHKEVDSVVRGIVASRKDNSPEILEKLVNDKSERVVAKTIKNSAQNPNFTEKHLDKLVEHPSFYVRQVIPRHPLANKKHLDTLINDVSEDVVASVFDSPLHTKEHYEKASKHPSGFVRVVSQESPFANNR